MNIMAVERQDTFGWAAAADLFLGGVGAGLFLISFIMELLDKYEPLARIGTISGPILVLVATFILFADLGVKTKFYRLFRNPLSWMSRGTWVITIFILFGLAYSLPAFWQLDWKGTALGNAIGIVAAIFAILTSLYTGFLFAAVKRISFWNTAALPLLFFASSLYGGMAILLLIAPFFTASPDGTFSVLVIAEIILILIQLFVLGIFLEIAKLGSTPTAESARMLRGPAFVIGVIVAGLIVPLGLLSYYAAASNTLALPMLAGILLLVSNFFLRYYILRAGVRVPVYP